MNFIPKSLRVWIHETHQIVQFKEDKILVSSVSIQNNNIYKHTSEYVKNTIEKNILTNRINETWKNDEVYQESINTVIRIEFLFIIILLKYQYLLVLITTSTRIYLNIIYNLRIYSELIILFWKKKYNYTVL